MPRCFFGIYFDVTHMTQSCSPLRTDGPRSNDGPSAQPRSRAPRGRSPVRTRQEHHLGKASQWPAAPRPRPHEQCLGTLGRTPLGVKRCQGHPRGAMCGVWNEIFANLKVVPVLLDGFICFHINIMYTYCIPFKCS